MARVWRCWAGIRFVARSRLRTLTRQMINEGRLSRITPGSLHDSCALRAWVYWLNPLELSFPVRPCLRKCQSVMPRECVVPHSREIISRFFRVDLLSCSSCTILFIPKTQGGSYWARSSGVLGCVNVFWNLWEPQVVTRSSSPLFEPTHRNRRWVFVLS